MRELSTDDLRWVAGGLPSSGYEGENIYENGVYYTWIDGSWVENLVVEPEDPTPGTVYTWEDFLADQVEEDFLYYQPIVYSSSFTSALGDAAETIKKWRDLTSSDGRDVVWRENHTTFDGSKTSLMELDVYASDGVTKVTDAWYDTQTKQWWFDTNHNGTADIVAKYNDNLGKMFADLDFNGSYETELNVVNR